MGFFGGSDSADDAEAKKKPSGVASALRSAGHATGLVEKTEEEKTCEDKCEEAIPLTWTQRLIGVVGCASIGFLLSFCSFFRFRDCMGGDCAPFGVFYTLGNVIILCGTFFWKGPCTQFFEMFKKIRVCATAVFLITMVLTIIFAAIDGISDGARAGLIIIFCMTQSVASFWYTLTWIKFYGVDYTAADFVTQSICGCKSTDAMEMPTVV